MIEALLILSLFGQWYIPESIDGSVSMREREKMFEWEVLTGFEYPAISSDIGFERENDHYYWIIKINGEKSVFMIDTEADITKQSDIDRQTIMIGKKFGKDKESGILAGATTHRWSDPTTAFTFKVPLYWGYVKHITNFRHNVRVWEVLFKFPRHVAEKRINPYIKYEWLSDGNKRFWKIKSGINIKLKE